MAHHPNPDCVLVLTSSDKMLKLLVTKTDGDFTIGFEGHGWHTHGDVLLADYDTEVQEEAVGSFIEEVITGEREISILSKGGRITDVSVGYRLDSPFYSDPRDDPHLEPDENVEVRRWGF